MPNSLNQTLKESPRSNILLASVIILILGVMILPIPTFFMDILMVMNITGALVILFVALYVMKPLEFSVFPGLLLIVTLFRLSLNVATTRLILGNGYAGEVIESFGNFVVQGNYVVGSVIFLILVIINFVVITKGATRVAEVSARFTLDAMPGKQMAIDADLNAGLIDDVEAKDRRESISLEADFYGSMDGAVKFVRGDAIAGLLITSINIIGGLAIGVSQRGLSFSEAASVYTLLTIGDGLVAQIPALIISTAAGILITRAATSSDLGTDISGQITSQPRALTVTALVAAILAIVPGMPFTPFFIIAILLGGSGYLIQKNQKLEFENQQVEEEETTVEVEDKIEDYLHPDPIEIEIGYGLIPLVDANQGGNLLGRITTIRKSIAIEMGLVIPPIRIRDNVQLKSNAYVIKIYGIKVSSGEVIISHYMVLNPDDRIPLEGIKTVEPTYQLPAIWILEKDKEKAEVAGYTVVESPAVIATHLMDVLKNSSYKLLEQQQTKKMLDHLKETHSAIIDGLVPDIISLGVLTKILKNLLEERIPISNLVLILETISDYAPFTKDPDVLTEYVRSALSETLTELIKRDQDQLQVTTFEPQLEERIMETIKKGNGQMKNLGFSPGQVNNLFMDIGEKVEHMVSDGSNPVIIVSPQIRRPVRNFIEPVLPNVSVLSYSELTTDTNLESVGTVRYPVEA